MNERSHEGMGRSLHEKISGDLDSFMTRWWNFVWKLRKLGFGSYIEFVYQIVDAMIIRKRCGSVPETGDGM